ncbi:MAG: glycosyltransferase [Sarcina sp.]
MLLSVIVPVYNVEGYLDKCIESLIYDSNDIEILLVNDGSTDNSLSICEKYAKEFSNIKVINKKNGGLSSARNAGMKEAVGKYLMFIDSDDYIVQNSMSKILKTIQNKNIDVFMSGYYEVCDGLEDHLVDFKINNSKDIDEIKKDIIHSEECIWTAWKFIVKREYLDENKIIFKESYLHEDIDYTTRLLLTMKTFEYMDFFWYSYRVSRAGSIMNVRKIKSTVHIAEIVIDLKEYIEKGNFDKNLSDELLEKLSITFFESIRYALNSTDEELKNLAKIVSENRFLLTKSTVFKHRMFSMAENIIGFYGIMKLAKKIK